MTKKEQQIERIRYFEGILNEVKGVLEKLEGALDAYEAARPKIGELEKYYTGADWTKDFSASEKGKLPEDLLCGVLSEDGISDALDDDAALKEKIRDLFAEDEVE
jgi:hypothetical protein